MLRGDIPSRLEVGDSAEIVFSPSCDNAGVMEPAIHIPAIGAVYLLVPSEVWELCPIPDAYILVALYLFDAEYRKNDVVVDFEEDIADDDRDDHEIDNRRAYEPAQDIGKPACRLFRGDAHDTRLL